MIGPLPSDLLQERNFIEGSAALEAALHRYFAGNRALPAPGRFRWSATDGGYRGPRSTYSPIERQRVALAMAEREAMAERQRTRRDPCFRCGVRADHGCSHTRGAL